MSSGATRPAALARGARCRYYPRMPAATSSDAVPYTVAFYLTEEFPMLAFASAVEPLRAANRLACRPLFEWRLVSRHGGAVCASNGIEVAAQGSIADDLAFDLLLVCAGSPRAGENDAALARWLRRCAREGVALGGISLGAYVLARAGVLDGRRCTLHWESLGAFAEAFPRVHASSDLFVIDDGRYTCAGGTAALDMMLQLVTHRAGRALAHDVSEQFIHSRIRDTHDPQRMALHSRVGVANDRLVAAIGIMESAEEEPPALRDIARRVGLSARQLERLFAKYLDTSPSRYHLNVRLQRARAMLQQTTRPILDIALACGFVSASHFSRCYRELYGERPSEGRANNLSGRVTRAPAASGSIGRTSGSH